jgi:hypothetical protein
LFCFRFSEEKKNLSKNAQFCTNFNAKLLVMICTPNSFKTTALAEKIINDFVSEFNIDDYSITIYNDTNMKMVSLISQKNTSDLIGLSTHTNRLSSFFLQEVLVKIW